jgi:hypothetical protein
MASTLQGVKERRLCSALLRRPSIETVQPRPVINVQQQFRASMMYANAMASYQVQLVQRRCTTETEGITSFLSQKKNSRSFFQKNYCVLQ